MISNKIDHELKVLLNDQTLGREVINVNMTRYTHIMTSIHCSQAQVVAGFLITALHRSLNPGLTTGQEMEEHLLKCRH